ncbi:hypothetical protein JG688_00009627 [Phytophthora aleatoria]|uniref:Uncharacterized protein n=1 Tax=Phytophthora aleatoria TaxID=2496075 RepID=A0A8J5INX0_9STRA|nr:hypothetical protein JG688_00009627 [Phytophthora aleatoria]
MTTNSYLDEEKFCSKLKVYGAKGKKDQSSKVQNHAETAAILKPVASKLAAEPSASRVCITDNANGTRGLIEKVFSGAVTCKQDPFHVIQRFSEKVGAGRPTGSAVTRVYNGHATLKTAAPSERDSHCKKQDDKPNLVILKIRSKRERTLFVLW